MIVSLHEFGLKIQIDGIHAASACFKPSTWPPEHHWPTVTDQDGKVVSRWGDKRWDISPWAGKSCSLNFEGADNSLRFPISAENGDLLRLAIGYLIWGPDGLRAIGTIVHKFSLLRRIFKLCSKEGINASSLSRFPRVIEKLPETIARSAWLPTLNLLEQLYDAREFLGFVILDRAELTRLSRLKVDYSAVQTPYIPSRIWTYQLIRLRECLDDFLSCQNQIELFFKYCLEAYTKNYGSLDNARLPDKQPGKAPFHATSKRRRGCTYLGTFLDNAEKFGLRHILEKWVGTGGAAARISAFSTYLSLVTSAGLAYIANLTLQRKEEVAPLRCSCLVWEHDEKLGRIAIICGPTQKTEDDVHARWAASPSVEAAVKALTTIAHLRMLCDANNALIRPTSEDIKDPYLFSSGTEPWASGTGACKPYHIRTPLGPLAAIVRRYPKLFDIDKLRINRDDLKITNELTPNLCEKEFSVGKVWPLGWHQYRRTGTVNMFASGVISDSSMQQLLKQMTFLSTVYYGQGHTRLHLNDETKENIVAAQHEMNARRLQNVVSDRFISPTSPERKDALVINIITAKDSKKLTQWSKSGKVSYRETRLGGCLKTGSCEYGGVESVSRCAGGDLGKPCTEAIYDREKETAIRLQLAQINHEMERLPSEQPRYKALDAERRAMENYLNVIKS